MKRYKVILYHTNDKGVYTDSRIELDVTRDTQFYLEGVITESNNPIFQVGTRANISKLHSHSYERVEVKVPKGISVTYTGSSMAGHLYIEVDPKDFNSQYGLKYTMESYEHCLDGKIKYMVINSSYPKMSFFAICKLPDLLYEGVKLTLEELLDKDI